MNLDITCVNKIKVEKHEEFETSIFSKVYETAESLVKEIIDLNIKKREKKDSGDAEIFAEGNNVCNIISFTGKRGMGKSSAMLSFAYALDNDLICDKEKFYVLPKIDMSMVTPNESLLDIVLAYMWDEYEKIDNNSFPKEETITSLKRKFIDVKDSYMRFKKANKKDYEDELYSVGELKSLAKSLQLRNSFSSLVCDFLDKGIDKKSVAPSDKYLVLAIDDLDLVSEKPVEVLEQIKNFLSIPQTIVLTTLDIERGILNKMHELEEQFSGRDYFSDSDGRVLEYATDYMAKVIPFNRRIYMPDIQEKRNGEKISIDIELYGDKLEIKKSKNYPKTMDYEHFCNLLLFRYTGILTDPKMDSLFGEHESLRGIVNGLNALYCSLDKSLSQEENELSAREWIKKETMVIAEKLDSNQLYNFYVNSCKYPMHRFPDFMVQSIYSFATKEKGKEQMQDLKFDFPLNGITYSEMLAFFVKLKRTIYISDWDKIKNALWVYAAVYKRTETRKVFSKVLEDVLGGIIERNVFLPRIFNATLSDSIREKMEFSDSDYNILTEFLKCALFTDVDQLIKNRVKVNNEAGVQLDEKEIMGSVPKANPIPININAVILDTRISFDNFIKNMCNYSECCKKVIDWILEGVDLAEDPIRVPNKGAVYKELLGRMDETRWKKWKRKFNIETIDDLFSLSSLGYMVGLAERVDLSFRKNPTSLFVVIYNEMKETVYEYMVQCERYYFMKDDGKQKSDAWKEMFEIPGIESVSLERQQRMINQTIIDKSQVITM